MFQFTQTTVINSGTDTASGLTKYSGANNVFKVLRSGVFAKSNIKSFYKRVGYNGVLSTATFTMPTASATAGAVDYYRIELILKASGAQPSMFAVATNPYKSKIIHIEFKVEANAAASAIAASVKKAVDFYQANLYPFITASVTAGETPTVVIRGADEYTVFTKAEIQKLTSATVSVYPDDQNVYTKVSDAVIANGKEGFGTYTYIMKDLRLPSLEATRFTSPTLEEMPVVGGLYNQYTLEYCKDRGILGTDAVGDDVTSITTHVFYVLSTLATAFEAAVTAASLTLTTVA